MYLYICIHEYIYIICIHVYRYIAIHINKFPTFPTDLPLFESPRFGFPGAQVNASSRWTRPHSSQRASSTWFSTHLGGIAAETGKMC